MDDALRIGASVATPLGLGGFVAGAVLIGYVCRLRNKRQKLEALPEDERAKAIDNNLSRYGLNAGNLTREEKARLLRDELDKKYRFSIHALYVCAVVVIVALVTVTIAYLAKNSPQDVALESGTPVLAVPVDNSPTPKARYSISPQAYASCVTGVFPDYVFQKLLGDAAQGMRTELRAWEELTSNTDRNEFLDFTDRFVACPQQTTSEKGKPEAAHVAGMHINLELKRGVQARQLIVRDIVVEVVQFRSVAPTFIPGAALVDKPVIAVEIGNNRSHLPWSFHAKWVADSRNGPFRELLGQQIHVQSGLWETFLLRILATDRGIYEYHIHVDLQQDDEAPVRIRLTEKPLVTGFFSGLDEDHRDYRVLRDRYIHNGGLMWSKVAFAEWYKNR